jgi:hypothetical protein
LRFDIVQDLTRLRVTTVDGLAPVPGASVRVSAGRSVVELVTDEDGWVGLDVPGLEKAAARGGLSVAVSHEDYEPVEGELASAGE